MSATPPLAGTVGPIAESINILYVHCARMAVERERQAGSVCQSTVVQSARPVVSPSVQLCGGLAGQYQLA